MFQKSEHAAALQHASGLCAERGIEDVYSLRVGQSISRQHGRVLCGQGLGDVLRCFQTEAHAWCQNGVPSTGVLGWALSCACMAPER